ncbi:MAG TPA: TIGR03118 family protein [Terracidiphilus sp.]
MKISLPLTVGALFAAVLLQPGAAKAADDGPQYGGAFTPLPTNEYLVTNLTTNLSTGAPNTDPNLVNPWGISRSSGSPWWVSDNGAGLATLYTGTGSAVSLVVTIPPAQAGNMGSPTGTIFNGTTEFAVAPGKPAAFLFVTEDGTVSGWNPGVMPTTAVIAVNESGKGASFKGLTSAVVNLHNYPDQTLLYVADFTRGKVEVFDAAFHQVHDVEDRINDSSDVPEGYGPFNVQNLGGNIYVSYAKRGSGIDEQDGAGLGRVRVFTPEGHLLMRLEHGSFLNAPWGMAIAPSDFGPYSHDILVGNFGSGWIAAFDPITGRFMDFLRDMNGNVITIPGLWGISPGNDGKAGNATSLYFTAGGADEASGTFGTITALENQQGNAQ